MSVSVVGLAVAHEIENHPLSFPVRYSYMHLEYQQTVQMAMFKALRAKWHAKDDTRQLYGRVVARARHAAFYRQAGVPDTLDGRFEVMCLHVFLLLEAFETQSFEQEAGQKLVDLFMEDMEAGLREAGVGDTVVPKRLQKMSRVFLGRAHAWREAGQDSELLTQALDRNLLPMGAMSETGAILSANFLDRSESDANLT